VSKCFSIPTLFLNICQMQAVCCHNSRDVEAVKFLWKWKQFEERSWKQKRTRKRLTLYRAGSERKKIPRVRKRKQTRKHDTSREAGRGSKNILLLQYPWLVFLWTISTMQFHLEKICLNLRSAHMLESSVIKEGKSNFPGI